MQARTRHITIWSSVGSVLLVAILAMFAPADDNSQTPPTKWALSRPDPSLGGDDGRSLESGAESQAEGSGSAFGGYDGHAPSPDEPPQDPPPEQTPAPPDKSHDPPCGCGHDLHGGVSVEAEARIEVEIDVDVEAH